MLMHVAWESDALNGSPIWSIVSSKMVAEMPWDQTQIRALCGRLTLEVSFGTLLRWSRSVLGLAGPMIRETSDKLQSRDVLRAWH